MASLRAPFKMISPKKVTFLQCLFLRIVAFPPSFQRSLAKEKAAKGGTATGNSTKSEEYWVDKTAPEIALSTTWFAALFQRQTNNLVSVGKQKKSVASNLPVTSDTSTSGASDTDNKLRTASASLCCRNFAHNLSFSTRNAPKTITSKSNAGLGHQFYHSYLAVASLKSLAKINDHDGRDFVMLNATKLHRPLHCLSNRLNVSCS